MLDDLAVGFVGIDRLELEVTDLATDPGAAVAERFQRRRTRLRGLAVRITQPAVDARVAQIKKQLAGIGVTQASARLDDGYLSVRARAADGLAAADLSFHVHVVSSGVQLRALASAVRVHGHLPTPGPVIADRLLGALLGAGDAPGLAERPSVRGLCDVEVDLVGAVLWHVLPPSGWRLPAVTEIELTHIRVARAAIELTYGPAGTRGGELGVREHTHQLAAAHDLMHSVDQQVRDGHLEDAMRGYRALLAASGPDQPLLLERILALAAARPAWFFDGLELARQALGRWPKFAPASAALASITLAQGDAREAAKHLEAVARLASAESDDDQSALAALAAARLLRVLDARAATQLYQLALEHDPSSAEAADALADRLADEQRWPELVRLVRARVATTDPGRAVQLHLRLADVFVHRLADPAGAQHELAAARAVAPDDPAVHEMTATILVASDPAAATAAWREVARLAEARGDHRTGARAWARLGDLLAEPAAHGDDDELARTSPAEDAWRRSLELDPLQADALVGLAAAAAARNDHGVAADLYERLRGLGLAQVIAARHELALARSLVALGRIDDARASLRRATLAGGETAAEAHATLAELADAAADREHAAAELEIAIGALIELAAGNPAERARLSTRAAELAVARAMQLDKAGQSAAAAADWQRAYAIAQDVAPEVARDAGRTLLARSGDDPGVQRRWIDAVLATRPPPSERAALLARRADVRRRGPGPELAAALADLHEAIALTEATGGAGITTRRRAHHLAAELFAQTGEPRSRAQALAALAALAERPADRIETETAAATAWLAADDPAAALSHGARAHAQLIALTDRGEIPIAVWRDVLSTLGEAAWRQRAWPDVIRAYRDLVEDPGPQAPRLATFRYRLAVAADRAGEQPIALAALRPLVDDPEATRGASPELRAQALRLFADLAERAGDLLAAATGLESFAAIGGDGSATARADAVYRAGELFRRAERGDDAIRCLETALRISDAHMPALDALEAAWRERRDLERVAVIIGRKVAATARHPSRQKPLLSRLGDLQDELGRPDVARATHQRALEIDPMWRPSLRYITLGLRDGGQVVAAAGGLAQLAGELHGDHGVDLAIVTAERKIAAEALAELVIKLDDAQVDAVRSVAAPALERAALDNADVGAGLARLRGEVAAAPQATAHSEDATPSGRVAMAAGGALSLRDAAARSRADGKLDEAFATLETANHVNPGDVTVLRELVELATQLQDHVAAARHLTALALRLSGARRGDALLELADIYYDKLDDAVRGRDTMRRAADAFASGSRRDATLRMLASEAGTHLAWDIAVEAILSIPLEKRTQADFVSLATALMRAGRDADAVASIEAATAARRFDDGGELERQLLREIQRKTELARSLEDRAALAAPDEAAALRDEAQQLRIAIGQPGTHPLRDAAAPTSETPKTDTAPWPLRTKTKPGLLSRRVPPAPAGSRTRASQPPPLGVVAAEPSAAPPADAGVPEASDLIEPSSGVPTAALDEHDRADPGALAAVLDVRDTALPDLARGALSDRSALPDDRFLPDDSALSDGRPLPDSGALPDDSALSDGRPLPDDSVSADGHPLPDSAHPIRSSGSDLSDDAHPIRSSGSPPPDPARSPLPDAARSSLSDAALLAPLRGPLPDAALPAPSDRSALSDAALPAPLRGPLPDVALPAPSDRSALSDAALPASSGGSDLSDAALPAWLSSPVLDAALPASSGGADLSDAALPASSGGGDLSDAALPASSGGGDLSDAALPALLSGPRSDAALPALLSGPRSDAALPALLSGPRSDAALPASSDGGDLSDAALPALLSGPRSDAALPASLSSPLPDAALPTPLSGDLSDAALPAPLSGGRSDAALPAPLSGGRSDAALPAPSDRSALSDAALPAPLSRPVPDAALPAPPRGPLPDAALPTPLSGDLSDAALPALSDAALHAPSDRSALSDAALPTPTDRSALSDAALPAPPRGPLPDAALPTPLSGDLSDAALPAASDRSALSDAALSDAALPAASDRSALSDAALHALSDAALPTPSDRSALSDAALPAPSDRSALSDTALPAPSDRSVLSDTALPAPSDRSVLSDTALPAPSDRSALSDAALPAQSDRSALSDATLPALSDRSALSDTAHGARATAGQDVEISGLRDRRLLSIAELAAAADRGVAPTASPASGAAPDPDRDHATTADRPPGGRSHAQVAPGGPDDADRSGVPIVALTDDRDGDVDGDAAPSTQPEPPANGAAPTTPVAAPAAPDRGAAPVAVAHSTSMQMSAVDLPAEVRPAEARPAEVRPAEARSRTTFSQPTLGRIKLVPRATTRPGLGSLRPAAPSPEREPQSPAGATEDASDADDTSGSWQSVSNPALTSGPTLPRHSSPPDVPAAPAASVVESEPSVEPEPAAEREPWTASPSPAAPEISTPSVTITGTPEETALAVLLAAASADRNRLFAARRAEPDDPSVLLALLAHLGDREPAVRRELLDEAERTSHGRALAIALHELAVLAREGRDPGRATALWTRAYQTDPAYPAVWMPLADALAAADDTDAARELYEAVARSGEYDITRRAFAADRADALGRDDSIVSGEIKPRAETDLEEARLLAESEDWPGAIDAAERAATARPNDPAILEALERIYFASGNVTAASEAIGRQLLLVEDPAQRAALWRRRARMYRDALGRDAEAYRCLKEAHTCAPADPEIAYQLRTAAMVRGEWPLAASLLYREIAAASNPRDRGALHLELALIYEERLDDYVQAQANYEQALAFDPTIPAVKLPLARRYEAIGRSSDAARLYEEAAATARAADRGSLLEAAARCRVTAASSDEPDLAAELDRAEAAGDLDAALELAHQLWRAEPGHPAAFRVLANVHRTSGDLAALTELTSVRASRAGTPDERATAWLEVARLAEELAALDQAARAYDLALIEDPGHISALDARGALAFRLSDFATADLIYRDLGAGESVLGDDELALRRSIIAEQLARDTEALHLAQVAASLAPGRRDVMMRVQELATRIGELPIAVTAARAVLELVPLDDDEAQIATHFALVELLRASGLLDDAVYQLEKILRDHPVHAGVIEALSQVHAARGDWTTATRYLYQLVPLAPSPSHRAERLYQLGEVVLVHVNDIDRADDVFLRASDLDPGHVPTLRRLLDVYWRADDPAGIVEVATELADKDALISGPTPDSALARALIAAALVGDTELAERLQIALGDNAARHVAAALAELAGRTGRLQLGTASTAIAELARRGLLDLAKLRAATAGTPAANSL